MNLKKEQILIQQKEDNWKIKKQLIIRKKQLAKEKRELFFNNFHLSTTKKLIWFLFINCTLIELFVGYITLKSFYLAEIINEAPDLTPLITLIGAVVGEVIGYTIYAIKSAKENCENGITYMTAKYQLEQNNCNELEETEEVE